jgi:CrcB protein
MLGTVGWVALGGAFGAVARFLVSGWAIRRFGDAFPYGTLIVNVVGSLALGVLGGLAARRAGVPDELRALIAVGFLGAFTTFSTFAVDTLGLAVRPSLSAALTNVIVNNGLALLAALIGLRLAGPQ